LLFVLLVFDILSRFIVSTSRINKANASSKLFENNIFSCFRKENFSYGNVAKST
jgi:hypothetical protein